MNISVNIWWYYYREISPIHYTYNTNSDIYPEYSGIYVFLTWYVCIHPSIDVTIEARCSRALPRQPDRYDIRRQGRTAQTQNTKPGNTEENISNFSWTFLSKPFVEPSNIGAPKKDLSSLLTVGTVNCKSFSWKHFWNLNLHSVWFWPITKIVTRHKFEQLKTPAVRLRGVP